MNNLHEFQGDEEPEAVGWLHLEVVKPKNVYLLKLQSSKLFPNYFPFFFSVVN